MASFEEYEAQITSEFQGVEKLIDIIEKSEGQLRQTRIKKCDLELRNIQDEIDMFELEIHNLEKHEEELYRKKLEKLQNKFQQVRSLFQFKKIEQNDVAEQLFARRQQNIQQHLQNF